MRALLFSSGVAVVLLLLAGCEEVMDKPSPAPMTDTAPSFSKTVADQAYLVEEIVSLTLPHATGGDGPLTYSLAPEIPGLMFDATTRTLSGTPTTAGTYDVEYKVEDNDTNDSESDAATLSFTITVKAPPESEFRIEVIYATEVPSIIQVGLTEAVEYWQKAVAADGGPPLAITGGTDKCALPSTHSGGETDDLLIVVAMAPMPLDITIVGGVTIDNTPLAIAYSCAHRENGLPYFGRVDDEHRYTGFGYDAYNIARHEIAHLLGFGSSPAWKEHESGGYFHGPEAVRVFGGPVPTHDGHWLSVPGLTWDIMSVPRSVVLEVTLAALADIGHTVDYSYAEPSPF